MRTNQQKTFYIERILKILIYILLVSCILYRWLFCKRKKNRNRNV